MAKNISNENYNIEPSEKLTAQRTAQILREHGNEVTLEQAEKILEYISMLCEIQFNIYKREQLKKLSDISSKALNQPDSEARGV